MVDTFDTGKFPEEKLSEAVRKVFELDPAGIIRTLDLKKPIYQKAAGEYGAQESGNGHDGTGPPLDSAAFKFTERHEEFGLCLGNPHSRCRTEGGHGSFFRAVL
jgi:hypothetical protein